MKFLAYCEEKQIETSGKVYQEAVKVLKINVIANTGIFNILF